MGWQRMLWRVMDGQVITQFSPWYMLFSCCHLFGFCGGGGVFDEKQGNVFMEKKKMGVAFQYILVIVAERCDSVTSEQCFSVSLDHVDTLCGWFL